MKTISILFIVLSFCVHAEDKNKDEKKIYSQKEFDEKLQKEVDILLKKIQPHNLSLLTKELLEREKELELAKVELKQREEVIKLNEADLIKKYAEFNQEQEKIISCLDKNKDETQKRVSHMVNVISAMKPVKAGEVLSVQEPNISVQILSQLNPEKISKIFNSMDKEISARLQKQYLDMKK